MREHRDSKTLLKALNDYRDLTFDLIAIDGVDGSGKSTLALSLSETTGWTVLHLDNYLQKGQGTYVEHLDVKQLSNDLRASVGTVLVEGVCVLAALKRIGEHPRAHVYVKRLGPYGNWLDEDESRFECPVEDKLAELSAQVAVFVQHSRIFDADSYPDTSEPAGLSEFRQEVIRYHAAYRPLERASYIYERVDA